VAGWPDADELASWMGATLDTEAAAIAVAGVNGWMAERTGVADDATTVPDGVRLATLIYAAKNYRRKDSPDGVAGSNEFTGVIRVVGLDATAESMLVPYITPTIG